MIAYRITDWTRFEASDHRKCRTMNWVAIPINHDGLGYIEIMERQNGASVIGCWLLILQIAARCPRRGLLISDGGRVLGPKELALKARAAERDMAAAIPVLVEAGWVQVVRVSQDHPDGLPETSGELPEASGSLRTTDRQTGQDRTGQDKQFCSTASSERDEGPSFEDFWAAYGKKVGKKAAQAQWAKLSPEDRAAALEGVPDYVAAKPDPTYRKDPERFLKGRHWEDEVPAAGEQQRISEADARPVASCSALREVWLASKGGEPPQHIVQMWIDAGHPNDLGSVG